MSFLLGALPSLFSSPLVKNTISSIGGTLWDILKKNAGNAFNNIIKDVKQEVKPFVEPMEEEDNEDIFDEEIPISKPTNTLKKRRNINNISQYEPVYKKRVKRK